MIIVIDCIHFLQRVKDCGQREYNLFSQMPACVVKWCRNNSTAHSKSTGISFHRFPKKATRRELWIKAVRLERQEEAWRPSKGSTICSIHFHDNDFYIAKLGKNDLIKKTAVPICTMVSSASQEIIESCNKGCDGQLNKIEGNKNIPIKYISSTNRIASAASQAVGSTLSIQEKNKQTSVQCPACGCRFGVPALSNTVDDLNVEFQHQATSNSGMPTCKTPIHIPSPELESALDSPHYEVKEKLRKREKLCKKRMYKIQSLQRKCKRLMEKNASLKKLVVNLKTNRTCNSFHAALFDTTGGDESKGPP